MHRLAIVALVSLAGCAGMIRPPARPEHVMSRSFDPNEFAAYTQAGTGSISGQSFLKTRGGDVKYCAGNEVLLVPATPYTEEWFRWAIVAGYGVRPDPRIQQYAKTMLADGEGRFTFDALAGGGYLLACNVRWEVPAVTGTELRETGGYTYAAVSLGPGQSEKVILTNRAPETWFAGAETPMTAPPKLEYGVVREKADAYESPSTTAKRIGSVPKGATVLVLQDAGDFLHVAWGTRKGFVLRSSVQPLEQSSGNRP